MPNFLLTPKICLDFSKLKPLVILGIIAIFFNGCSHGKPSSTTHVKFRRGWSYVEPEKEFLDMESGINSVSFSAPVIEGEKIIYGSERFGLLALNKFDGRKIWQKPMKGGVNSIPLIYQGKIFVGTNDGFFRCLDLNSGSEIWSVEFNMPAVGAPIIVDQRLITTSADEAVHSLDASTGKSIWIYKRPTTTNTSIRGGGSPSYIEDKIWVGFSDGTLVALDPQDGGVKVEKQFRDNLKFLDLDARPVPWKGGILVATYDGKLRYLRRDASLQWEFGAGGSVAPTVAGNGEVIYLPSSDGNIYSVAGASAKELWRYGVRRGVPTGATLMEEGNVLLVSSSVERIYAIDTATGHPLGHYDLGRGSGSFSAPVFDKDTKSFFVLSNYGRIYQFQLERK